MEQPVVLFVDLSGENTHFAKQVIKDALDLFKGQTIHHK